MMVIPGFRVGKLVVLEKDIVTKRAPMWLCKCDCGNIKSIREDHLIAGFYNKKGGTRSCGCLSPFKNNHCCGTKIVNRIGTIVNDYQYILRLFPDSNRSYKYLVYDLTNKYWRITSPRHIKDLKHSIRNAYKTPNEALDNYYKKYITGNFSNYKDENNIMTILYKNHFIWTKHFSFEECKDITSLPFDVAVFNDEFDLHYLIEYDGEQHFHQKGNQWSQKEQHKHDLIKNKYCFDNNIPLIRIPYDVEYTIDDLKLETTRFLLTPENEKEYYESRSA